MTEQQTMPPVPPRPCPPGGHTAYGVTVHEIGEDGECIIAFGPPDVRRFFAACNHLARTVWGWPNLADEHEARWKDTKAAIFQIQAWFDDRPHDGCEWDLHLMRPEGRTDEPVPVTMWRA